jgi:hypothetical protein
MDSPKHTETLTQSDDSHGYSRVSQEKLLAIKQLHKLGKTGQEIAAALEVHPSTVSRWLKVLEGGDNTVPEARNLMKAQALPAAMGIMEQTTDTDPRVRQGALKAVLALAGVQEGSAQVTVGVQVIVGAPGQPAGPDPFEGVIITKPATD